MGGSRSPRASADFRQAEAERVRRDQSGLSFPSVRHALHFLFERGPSMQSPLGQHPRGQQAADGSIVFVDVDGGRGGDLHEVLTTLATIHEALVALHLTDSVQHELLVLHVRDGKTLQDLGKVSHRSPSTVSAEIGKAEGFLLGWLRRANVVIPGRVDV